MLNFQKGLVDLGLKFLELAFPAVQFLLARRKPTRPLDEDESAILKRLAQQGLITLEAGIPMIFGANIGTCITASLASIGTSREAKRVALAQGFQRKIAAVSGPAHDLHQFAKVRPDRRSICLDHFFDRPNEMG